MNLRTSAKRIVCEDLWYNRQIMICHTHRSLNGPNSGKNDNNHNSVDDKDDKEKEQYEEDAE